MTPPIDPAVARSLRASEERLRLFVEHAPAAIAMFDREMRYLVASRRWLEDFRLGERDLTGLCHYDVFPEIPERWKELHRRCLAGESMSCLEEPFTRADGAVDWLRWAIHPWRDAEGSVGGMMIFSEVITERKQFERALGESEARHRAIFDTNVWAIATIDEHGILQSFNPAAEHLFGYPAAEIVGKNVSLLMPAPYYGEHDGYLHRYLATGEAKVIGIGREVVGRRRDGTLFPLQLAVSHTRLSGHHLFTGTMRDLTQEKASAARERELLGIARQNERLAEIGAMTTRIAHDFGNPLAGVRMNAELIVDRIDRNPAVTGTQLLPIAERLLATTRHLTQLVEDFKDFAREQRLTPTRIVLAPFVRELLDSWRPAATARHIALVADDLAAVEIRADVVKLQRVLDNLVKNAIEAIDHGPGTVRVSAGPVDGRARISIEDTGPGLPPGVDVFAMFETTKATGTGLGLPICREIVVAHGGTIDVAPRREGGTVFVIDLPADISEPSPAA